MNSNMSEQAARELIESKGIEVLQSSYIEGIPYIQIKWEDWPAISGLLDIRYARLKIKFAESNKPCLDELIQPEEQIPTSIIQQELKESHGLSYTPHQAEVSTFIFALIDSKPLPLTDDAEKAYCHELAEKAMQHFDRDGEYFFEIAAEMLEVANFNDQCEYEEEQRTDQINDQISQIKEAMSLIEQAQELVDDAIYGTRKESHYKAYGRYGFDTLLSNGNPHNDGLQTIIDELEKEL